MITLLYLVQVVIQQIIILAGIDLVTTVNQVEKQKKENDIIRNKVLEYQSLRMIRKEAGELGFRDATQKEIFYITQ